MPSGAIQGSISCPRTLQHTDLPGWGLNYGYSDQRTTCTVSWAAAAVLFWHNSGKFRNIFRKKSGWACRFLGFTSHKRVNCWPLVEDGVSAFSAWIRRNKRSEGSLKPSWMSQPYICVLFIMNRHWLMEWDCLEPIWLSKDLHPSSNEGLKNVLMNKISQHVGDCGKISMVYVNAGCLFSVFLIDLSYTPKHSLLRADTQWIWTSTQ